MMKARPLFYSLILTCFCTAPVFAENRTIYVPGGGEKAIIIQDRDKKVVILPKDGGPFKPPEKYIAPDKYKPPEKFTPPARFTPPPGYIRPYYNQ